VETGHLIRQVIAATAESSCNGAVALVFGWWRLWERLRGWGPLTELDYQFCFRTILFFHIGY
jgi:hypothetical protein